MNENFVIVERYTNPISAQLACGRLKAEGLFAILDDLYTIEQILYTHKRLVELSLKFL